MASLTKALILALLLVLGMFTQASMAVDVVEEDGEEQVIHFDGEEMEITPEQLQRYQEEMEARQKAAQQYLQVDVDFVETSYYFLDVEKDGLTLGEENEVLVGFTNYHENNINVSAIRISVMHPQEPSFYYLQNCTPSVYYQIVQPDTTQTFAYKFTPDSMLHPGEYVLVGQIYFEVDDLMHLNRFFNATVVLDEAYVAIDTQLLFIYASLIAIVCGVFYFISRFFTGKKTRRHIETGTGTKNVKADEEWIEHLQPKKKSNKKNN